MLLLLAAAAALAQPPDSRPAYEAASIKLNNSASGSSSSNSSRGQVRFTNVMLKSLIERAYRVKPFQVTGPPWMEDERFDIIAKFPEGTPNDQHAPMLRTLLEDRFKLAVHDESKDMQGYALVVAKSGFKLKPAEPGDASISTNSSGHEWTVTAKHTSTAQLVDLLSRQLGQMVQDQTGIEGVYDFEFRWTNNDQSTARADGDALPSLFTSVEETLGLRLRPQKVPVKVIVVDHVERMPIEN